MQFTYTPEQLALRERASCLTDQITSYEEPCQEGRGLPPEPLAEIRELTLAARLNAINMPVRCGGQGLSILDQEEKAGSDPSLIETVAERDGTSFRLSREKWFVTVGDVADFLIVQALVGPERTDAVPGRQGPAGGQLQAHAGLYAHVRIRASRVRLRRGAARSRAGARRGRGRVRADPGA